MKRRLLAVVAGALVAACVTGPALAAPAVLVTGVQTTPGAVEFFLTGRDLPAGAALSRAKVSVTADGVALPSKVREVASSAGGAPSSAVVLVVDTSGSMAGARIAAARSAAADYGVTAPSSVQLGLVTVAERPAVALRPTADRAKFSEAVTGLRAAGGTALFDGIDVAAELFDPKVNPAAAGLLERRIVVLSDGADTTSKGTVDQLRRRLANTRVTLDAVAFGAQADRAQLQTVVDVTGGRVLPAADAGTLSSVFRAMAAELSTPVVVSARVPAELAARSATLRVAVRMGGATLATETAVTFRADPTAAAPRAPLLPRAADSAALITAVAVLGTGLFLGAWLLLQPVFGRGAAQRRLRELDKFTARAGAAAAGTDASGSSVLRAALAMSERTARAPGRRERMELALDRAGSSLRVAEWQLIRAAAAGGGALLFAILLPWWLGAPVGLAAGWGATGLYLKLRADRRASAFADQLPDALQLVVGSIRSGFSLPQSIDALVREGAEPVAGELGRALAETRLGGDLEDALDRVGQRNASQDMGWLVMAIRIQREVGGNLSEVLETAVATMRERARLGRHVRALSAEGRLSAMVLMGMPIVLSAWMFVFRREYLRPLYTEPLGLLMLAVSVVMVAVGGLWLRKLVRVEV